MIEQKKGIPILVVDDEATILNAVKRILQSTGFEDVTLCQDSRNAEEILSGRSIKLMILDLGMPYLDGEELLVRVAKKYPEIIIIILTATDNLQTVVSCMNNGASNFLTKPIDKTALTAAVRQATELLNLKEENSSLRNSLLTDGLKHPELFSGIITKSHRIKNLFKYMEAIAHSREPVLITGENGTGKELFVKTMHRLQNPAGELVTVNVSGLDDTMFSDTLFGHKKGAFTDAKEARGGLVSKAEGGTLFLDEIGDLETGSQNKLLRLIQNREYTPLGSDQTLKADLRILLATNKDLKKLVKEEKFKLDLFYRLNIHSLHIPPLRERPEDIPLLIEHFIDTISKQYNLRITGVSSRIRDLLTAYRFPGNIRELEGIIKNAMFISSPGPLSLDAVKEKLDESLINLPSIAPPAEMPLAESKSLPTLKEATEKLVKAAYKKAAGNISVAAEILGITRQALSRRLKNLEEEGKL